MINNKAQGKHSSYGLIKNKYDYANQYRQSPLKREIESICNPHNIDTDCDTIANLLCSFKEVINKDMSKGNYHVSTQIRA